MVGTELGAAVGVEDDGENVGDVDGCADGADAVGDSVWWLHAPGTASSSASLSIDVVVYPLRHSLCSRSQPHSCVGPWDPDSVQRGVPSLFNDVPPMKSTEPRQSCEHVSWRQWSAVGVTVGVVDGEADGPNVGTPDVGAAEGAAVGAPVGPEVGPRVVGFTVGRWVGSNVGCPLGAADGMDVGTSVFRHT